MPKDKGRSGKTQEKLWIIFLHDTPSRLNESVNEIIFLDRAGGGLFQNQKLNP